MDTEKASQESHFKMLGYIKGVSGFIFGLIVPLLLIWSASSTVVKMVNDMNDDANSSIGHSEIATLLENYNIDPAQGNKYAFTAYLIAQQTNEKVIKKKTLLKAVLMQLGLVIVSIGLLFVVLGFKEGGVDGGASGVGGIDFNITIGSTGLATIFFGVLMITLGGVVSNKFTTVGVPQFSHHIAGSGITEADILKGLEHCKDAEARYREKEMSVFICIESAVDGLFKKEQG